MKSLFTVFFYLLLIYTSSVYSSSSSSSSSESCYTTGHCILINYVQVDDINNNVKVYGSFGYVHQNLNVTIDGLPCLVYNVSSNLINCYFPVQYLSVGATYSVEISQNGVSYIGYYYYNNSGINCGYGYYYNGQCVCYLGYHGSNCQFVYTPYITYISDVYGLDGGNISISGWFTDSSYDLMFYIDEVSIYGQINVTYSSNDYISGFAPRVSYEGPHNIYMVNSTTNTTLWVSQVYYVKPNSTDTCLNNCSSNGNCINSTCYCNYGWYGPDCSYSNSTSSQSSSEESSSIITCINSGNSLTINSYKNISCTGYGPTYCVDNYSYSTCSTDQETGIIKCTVGPSWTGTKSLTCTGTHIECRSSIVKCIIDLEGSFHVNDRLSTSNIVMVDDKHAKFQDVQEQPNIQRNSASSFSLNVLLLLSFALLLVLF